MTELVPDLDVNAAAALTDASALPTQAEAHYTTDSGGSPLHACVNCIFYVNGACERIQNEPLVIVPDGICDLFTMREGVDPTAPLAPLSVVNEMTVTADSPELTTTHEHVHEVGMVTDLKGQFPNVPTASGVDIAALTSGDNDPVYVTLKIAQIGRTSKAGYLYDEALVKSIVAQINQKRVGANFGHIKEEDRGSAYPLPDALWVGATLVGEIAYGKAYVRNADAADYVRDLKAVNGALGTSIWGEGTVTTTPDGARRFKALELEKVDFAPPERASLNMGGEFQLTSEMNTDLTKDTSMGLTKEQLAGVSATDLCTLLDDGTWEQVAQMYAKKNGKKMLASEMADSVEKNITEMTTLTTQTSQQARELDGLRTRVSEYETREFNNGVTALVAEALPWKNMDKAKPEQQSLARSLTTQFHEAVVKAMDGKRDLALAKAKIAEIAEGESFRPLIATVAQTLAGGNAVVNALDKKTSLEDLNKKLRDARAAEGVA